MYCLHARRAVTASALLVLAGCGILPGTTPIKADAPRSSYVPQDAVLEVTEPMTVPRGRASLHFQEGQMDVTGTTMGDLPYCELFLRIPQVTERVINPGILEIDEVNDTSRQIAASSTIYGGVARGYELFQTEMVMHPRDGSGLRSLRCMVRRYEDDKKRYLTVGEIRQTLGNSLLLTLPSEQTDAAE
ncbi:MAG: hypothetical protein CMN28_07045 [Salinisphaeraceae bacterium]|nr:hypothetical protein [Salinisphaeraceae bacterium]